MKCILFFLSKRGLLSFIGIWLLYFINSICAQAPCYYPTGKLQTADTACNPGELNSMCCNRNDICLSNGLCFTTQSNILSRGVCWPLVHGEIWSSLVAKRSKWDDKNRAARISHGVQSHVLQYAAMKVCIARIPVKRKAIAGFFWR